MFQKNIYVSTAVALLRAGAPGLGTMSEAVLSFEAKEHLPTKTKESLQELSLGTPKIEEPNRSGSAFFKEAPHPEAGELFERSLSPL